MDMRDLYPHEILQDAINKSRAKSNFSVKMLLILSFLGGGSGVAFGCLRFPHLFDLHFDRRRRIGNGQYDADDGRTHDQIGQHEKISTQLGFGQYRQSGRRAVYGVFLGTLCRFG